MGLILGGVSPQDLILDGQSVSLWVGGNPPVKVWPTVVQITLGTFSEAQSQLRAALSDYGLDYRTVTEIPFGIELVGTGSAHGMFWDCSSLTTVPEMDTSNVTDMSYMFYGCSSLTHAPDMDTGNVTDMSYMFQGCSSLTHAPDMDTGNVTNMGGMFSGCQSLTYVPEMYTGHVTSTFVMFQGCSSLTDGNVRLIGRHPNVETAYMISGSGLTKEPFFTDVVQIPKAVDNSTSARDAFRAALTARGWDYKTITYLPFEIELVGSGNSVFDLFSNCSALQSVPSIPLPGVTTTRGMFHHCTSLTSVGDLYTPNVSNTMYMFWNCTSLTDGNVRLIGKHPNVETAVMISGSGLTSLPFRELVQITLGTYREARDQFRAALSERGLFYTSVTEIPFEIELVGSGSVYSMFESCTYLTHVPPMDTSNVTNMSRMFYGCQALTTVPSMDTSNVTDMGYMFRNCYELTHVPDMYTSNVTEMNSMFRICRNLTDGNVRLIGKHPNVGTSNMISGAGLTREPFYNTSGNPI